MKVAKIYKETASKSETYYYIEDFNDIIFSASNSQNQFVVSNEIKKMLLSLEKELNIINPNNLSSEIKKKTMLPSSSSASTFHSHSQNQKTEENWRENAEAIAKSFKATKFVEIEKGSIEKKITEFRVLLNKISTKNFSTQKPLIINMINEIFSIIDNAPDICEKIFKIVIEIVGSNHFFSNLYAELYKEIFIQNSFFKEKILEFYANFKLSINEIHFVDNNIDYDGFCNYKKINDNRRSMTLFFVNLVKCQVLDFDLLSETLIYFLDKSLHYIDEKERINEVEEISENIFVIISNFKTEKHFSQSIYEKINLISSMKIKEHFSLSNRVKFKYMDIVSALQS